ncbi:phage holin family protein [Dysgonomonas sp. BGC7]|uniref:phage holin family protein n=1 Tax=Dysgonomonas sp. BGC7 TaxID=1658008 RepID=UPI00068330D1|nr:phage holin family protein [Dysgonomonas sp. BGC7]MBD8390499.1 phage holin family protein [Dysgonomonas sp. BGC7]
MIQALLSENYDSLRFHLAIVGIMWLIVAIAMTADLVSGWRKAKERNEARTSYGLRRTVTKFVLYYAMMLFAFMFDCIGMFFYDNPFVTLIAAGFLIFIEGKSILEKAHDKDKRKLNKSLEDLSIILENKEDLIKGVAEVIKHQIEKENEITDKRVSE